MRMVDIEKRPIPSGFFHGTFLQSAPLHCHISEQESYSL